MTTYRAARRALSRKARRAEIRRQVRAAVAELSREYGPDYELHRVSGRCPDLAEEPRPGWLLELAPEQRWLHEQQTAWELALYFRPGAIEPESPWRRAMAQIYARAIQLALAVRAALCRPLEIRPQGLIAELVLTHPHTGPPACGRSWELVALSQSGP